MASAHDGDGYWSTPDADPRWLYHNVLVALDEKRGLNIGEPVLWAFHFDRLACSRASACCRSAPAPATTRRSWPNSSGPNGRVDAARDRRRAWRRRPRRNLEAWPRHAVRCADASAPIDGQWDVDRGLRRRHHARCLVARRAGRRRPPAAADDRPSSAAASCCGSTARATELAARSAGWVGFYPCAGARSEADQAALAEALDDGAGQQAMRSAASRPARRGTRPAGCTATAGASRKQRAALMARPIKRFVCQSCGAVTTQMERPLRDAAASGTPSSRKRRPRPARPAAAWRAAARAARSSSPASPARRRSRRATRAASPSSTACAAAGWWWARRC